MKRDGECKSLWQESQEDYAQLKQQIPDQVFDVLIVGGGITGLTAALLLQKSGKKCLLAESYTIGFGTTGGTTAHINTFFDTPYYKVISDFGEDNAKLLAKGAIDAISIIKNNVAVHQIECDLSQREGFLFATDEKQQKELEDIVEGCKKVGVPMDFTNTSAFPVPYLSIACVENQFQFNPAEYINGLAKAFEQEGGILLQNCRVEKINEKELLEAETSLGLVRARDAVYATHIPPGVNLLHFRCAPYRSYAMAFTLNNDAYPEALGYDLADPYHYYRSQTVDGNTYLIAGGEDHKTGHEEHTAGCFTRLESTVRKFFDVDKVAYKWSSQYFEPADGLPYIGHLPGHSEHMYVATGFSGNGMMYGSLAAIILTDIILGQQNEYQNLFSPARVKPVAGFSNFVKEAADVVGTLVGSIFSGSKIDALSDMAAGEGRVVKYEGQTLAVYKDESHQIHAVNSACSHIKCTVGWNDAEKTWDCPCHGSRFSIDGTVLTAPARKDLEKIDVSALIARA